MSFKSYRDAFFSQRQYDSDKWEHYFDIYDPLTGNRYATPVSYFEIGVQNGGSLEVARLLFGQQAAILGLDIDPRCARLEQDKVANRVFIGSQADEAVLNQVLRYCPSLDIVVDDGSHIQSHMVFSFLKLFPALSLGGIYIIEDTHTNYSAEHQDAFFGLGLYDYFKGLSERLNLDFMDASLRQSRYKLPRDKRPPRSIAADICRDIFSIEFFDSVIAIRKKSKVEPLRIRR